MQRLVALISYPSFFCFSHFVLAGLKWTALHPKKLEASSNLYFTDHPSAYSVFCTASIKLSILSSLYTHAYLKMIMANGSMLCFY